MRRLPSVTMGRYILANVSSDSSGERLRMASAITWCGVVLVWLCLWFGGGGEGGWMSWATERRDAQAPPYTRIYVYYILFISYTQPLIYYMWITPPASSVPPSPPLSLTCSVRCRNISPISTASPVPRTASSLAHSRSTALTYVCIRMCVCVRLRQSGQERGSPSARAHTHTPWHGPHVTMIKQAPARTAWRCAG